MNKYVQVYGWRIICNSLQGTNFNDVFESLFNLKTKRINSMGQWKKDMSSCLVFHKT